MSESIERTFLATPEEIPAETARAAHYGTSFVPDKRGKQRQEDYANYLNGVYQSLLPLATTAELRALLVDEMERFRDGYRRKFLTVLVAASRTMSPMITGPARFPVDRNNKRLETERRRSTELGEFCERAVRAIRNKIAPTDSGIIQSGDADAVEQLEKRIAERQKLQDARKEANKIVRKYVSTVRNLDGQSFKLIFLKDATPDSVKAEIMALGFTAGDFAAMMRPNYRGLVGFESFELTNNGAEIRRLQKRLASVKALKAQSHKSEVVNGVTIEEDPQENRIRLIFPGKPSAEIIEALKKRSFRWSPTLGAWQRGISVPARFDARQIVAKLNPQ